MSNPTTTYKPTNIPWLGDIPADWEVRRLKYSSKIIAGFAYKADEYCDNADAVPIVRIGDVKVNVDLSNSKKVPAKYLEITPEMIVKNDDILLALTGATIGKSTVYKSDILALLNQRVSIIRKNIFTDKSFLNYFIQSDYFRSFIDLECYGGAQENISTGQIGNLSIPLPPLQTQQVIANYLDAKCELIAKYIADKTKIIELLKEQKKSLIYNAVTKGLDPKSKLKPSGVEWLGDIPADWEVRRLGKLWKYCNRGQTPDYSENENDLCVINQSCVTYDGIKLSKAKFDKSANYETSKGKLQKGDILFNSTGTGTLGRVCMFELDIECICDSHVTILRVNPDLILAKFVNYFFKDQQDFVVSLLSEGATNQIELRSDWLKSLQIPFPSLQTQQNIVTHLDTQTAIIDYTMSKMQLEIDLIQEYKKSLIYNAVTGKIIM